MASLYRHSFNKPSSFVSSLFNSSHSLVYSERKKKHKINKLYKKVLKLKNDNWVETKTHAHTLSFYPSIDHIDSGSEVEEITLNRGDSCYWNRNRE